MGDFIELANSYYRLLHWIEGVNAEKKNTALRSLDRIKRFLDENGVEVIDLTAQPFSEGWAVKVMKIDESVPESELVFTRMIKPIVQINGELTQEGEVYVGRLQVEPMNNVSPSGDAEALTGTHEMKNDESPKDETATDNEKTDKAVKVAGNEECAKEDYVTDNEENTTEMEKCETSEKTQSPSVKLIVAVFGLIAAGLLLLTACCLIKLSAANAKLTLMDKKIDELTVADYRNHIEENNIVTFEIRNSEDTIVMSQPIGETVNSTVEINGSQVSITTHKIEDENKGE